MRIAIPVFSDEGIESKVYGHFGSAPCFVIYDMEKKQCETVENDDKVHEHGMCNPLAGFEGKNIDAIVTGGIGLRALQKIAFSGIKAFRSAEEMTVKEVAEAAKAGTLPEITFEGACGHHNCG
jgi:predicted Fe-Mo cluster-binding NifX family protein